MNQPASTITSTDAGQARGVLRPAFSEGEFQHHRQLPSPALAGLVAHYWHVAWDLRGLPAQEQATLPHPNVHLVVGNGQARIYGVHSGRFMRTLQGKDRVFGIKFKPGGFYPFYRQAVAQLGNTSIDVSACFGNEGSDFCEQILAADDVQTMCAAAETFLLHHQPPADAQIDRISTWMTQIEQDRNILTVEDVMAIADLDKRSLQRLFQKYVGIGPKWVIQRYRLHEAVAQVQAGKTLNWAALALELGYFDQAHFVRDFRKLVGMTPGEYEKSLG
ncbi:AraC family transcriptional regulator [Undibacterium sp. YM2]|uniref:helix-turn-helix domain-containing protein n=1 Tax=Undibacterium sp. YM2 TaxID=2058625 RepID=UPI001331F21D|nr:AraC family transcriptional regulator [Undibacterium sp. YM2]BBB68531.1 AraC family transcriptional regulator [Undibacterium sp. YM2]